MRKVQHKGETARRRPVVEIPAADTERLQQLMAEVRANPGAAVTAALTSMPHELMLKTMAFALCQAAGIDSEERVLHESQARLVLDEWCAAVNRARISPPILAYVIARMLHILAEGCKRHQEE